MSEGRSSSTGKVGRQLDTSWSSTALMADAIAVGVCARSVPVNRSMTVVSRRGGRGQDPSVILAYARKGKTVTVLRLDRIGRSLPMIFQTSST